MHSNFVALILILVLTTHSITSVVCSCGDASRGWKKLSKIYNCHEENEPQPDGCLKGENYYLYACCSRFRISVL